MDRMYSKLVGLSQPVKVTDNNKATSLPHFPFSVHYESTKFYCTGAVLQLTNGPNKLKCYTEMKVECYSLLLQRLLTDKHHSLLGHS